MPFESKAQAAWMFANKPEMAKEWADKTPSIKDLPEHVEQTPRVKTYQTKFSHERK